MNEVNPKISVIVPVYKAEAYLHRCVDSLLAQTFQDFEVLLIDDGSPDRSGEICDEYARKDSRVRVFHKENGGVSSARNLGLDNARGEWICFVDSDDWVGDTYIDDLLSNTICKEILVIQGYKVVTTIGDLEDRKSFKADIISKNDFIRLFSEYNICSFGFPWAKLFCKKIIRKFNIKFEADISYSEDLLFVFDYLIHINKVFFSSNTNYFYVDNLESLTKKVSTFSIESKGLDLFLERLYSISMQNGISLEYILNYSKDAISVFLYRVLISIYSEGRFILPKYSITFLKKITIDYHGLLAISTSGGKVLNCVLQLLRCRIFFIADTIIRLYLCALPLKKVIKKFFK